MKLSEFDYDLPDDLIAQHPLKKRDQARLLVINRKTSSFIHDEFKNIDQYLPSKSHLVINNSKVIPARLLGQKKETGAQVEIFLLKKLDDNSTYEVLMKPMKRLKDGYIVEFSNGNLQAEIINKDKRIVRFNQKNLTSYLEKHGHIPLPPYIKREDDCQDRTMYQTVYAKNDGSVASPTAGLHFTKPLIKKLKKKGHSFSEVTLHINYGTFKPVEAVNITDHQMHYEEYSLTQAKWNELRQAKESKQQIVAVGTTATRVLESVARSQKLSGETNIFMYPGFEFKMVDCLLTNFHLPLSTLLMLVYAFGGTELIKKAYQEAIERKYRFYSYGDAMLII